MKKFKHKKTGEIATYKDGVLKSSGFCVEIGVEPSSEFWEEVIEKDYEILSFEGLTSSRLLWVRQSNGLFSVHTTLNKIGVHSEEYLLKEGLKIYSVKRLSDGEVFTIGDKVDSTISNLGRPTELTGFMFINGKLKFGLRHLGYYPLSTIILPKKVLFKSFDGVDICEGDKLFTVEKGFYLIQEIKASKNTEELFKRRLFFSTKEAAQEFIILNKPCLSINDVTKNLEAFKNNKFILNELKELIKSKL